MRLIKGLFSDIRDAIHTHIMYKATCLQTQIEQLQKANNSPGNHFQEINSFLRVPGHVNEYTYRIALIKDVQRIPNFIFPRHRVYPCIQ